MAENCHCCAVAGASSPSRAYYTHYNCVIIGINDKIGEKMRERKRGQSQKRKTLPITCAVENCHCCCCCWSFVPSRAYYIHYNHIITGINDKMAWKKDLFFHYIYFPGITKNIGHAIISLIQEEGRLQNSQTVKGLD